MKLNVLQAVKLAWQQSAFVLVKPRSNLVATSKKKKPSKLEIGGLNTLVVEDTTYSKLRYLMAKISRKELFEESSDKYDLKPPENVRGMQKLVKEPFTKTVRLPAIKIEQKNVAKTNKYLKSCTLEVQGIAPVAMLSNNNHESKTHCLLLLDPRLLEERPLSEEAKKALSLSESSIQSYEVEMTFDNWSHRDIMRAVLPENVEHSAFNVTGHIALVSLEECVLPYAKFLGEIILSKNKSVRTVVTKKDKISGPYRNINLTLLAGEDNYVTEAHTEGCTFNMDYSKVYWNSRLAPEHSKIVRCIQYESVVYDMFAGIGPFAIPLAKKKLCTVFANDLNPYSYEYLQKNVDSNVKSGYGTVSCYNIDGREFVQTIVKSDLKSRITQLLNSSEEEALSSPSTHVIMNLPGQAVDFLDVFRSLLFDLPASALSNRHKWIHILPTIHCYTFISKDEDLIEKQKDFPNNRRYDIDGDDIYIFRSRATNSQSNHQSGTVKTKKKTNSVRKLSDDMIHRVKEKVEKALFHTVPEDFSVRFVRNVAPNKEMVYINFKIWPELVIEKKIS